jgi:hypothetical protein
MTRRPLSALLAGLMLAATATTLSSAPATASGGGRRVVHSGGCDRHAVWKLKVKGDNGRLEVEGEVDSDRRGQTWRWRLRHDGAATGHGTAVTAGRSGSFTVERRLVDLAGTDHVVFRAVQPKTGEVCRGVVDF